MTFKELELHPKILAALEDEGYEAPTPIQQQAIPPLLDKRDVLGVAQTGTGKTAAFSLPILQLIAERGRTKGPRDITALVVTPTRELAAQIGESIDAYGRHLSVRHTVIFGGVKQGRQVEQLRRGVDILIATPGRLLDLENQGYVDLSRVEFFVLDEADRMLDMGFINDIRKLLQMLPKQRQNLLFSATMPRPIAELAKTFLDDPVHVAVTPDKPTVEAIEQSVMFVTKTDKRRLLPWLIEELDIERAIVFTRTKHGANKLVKELTRYDIIAAAIHGNKSQGARQKALAMFKTGEVEVLVATDLASRGLDIEAVEYVINFDLPNEEESYVHRIGRTGRAGRRGKAISFCDIEEGGYLRDIERLIGFKVQVNSEHPYHDEGSVPAADARPPKQKRRGGGGGGNRQSRGRRSSPRSSGRSSNRRGRR